MLIPAKKGCLCVSELSDEESLHPVKVEENFWQFVVSNLLFDEGDPIFCKHAQEFVVPHMAESLCPIKPGLLKVGSVRPAGDEVVHILSQRELGKSTIFNNPEAFARKISA